MSPSSRRQLLPLTAKNKGAQKLEIRSQELYQIMDDAYLPSPSLTSVERRNAKHNYSVYVDTDGHLHDIDYRPFAHLSRSPCPSPRPRRRSQPSSPAYWETFKIPRTEEEVDVDPLSLHAFRCRKHPSQASPFEAPVDKYALQAQYDYSPPPRAHTGKTFTMDGNNQGEVVLVANNGVGCRRKSERHEVKVEAHGSQKETKDERTAKEKLHRKFVETSLSVRLSAIRTQRWLREHVHPRE